MPRIILLCAIVLACASGGRAEAQTDSQKKILQSSYVTDARKCLSELADAGRKANLYVDRGGVYAMVLDPVRSKLLPLLASAAQCFDTALPKKDIVRNPQSGQKSRIWYAAIEGQFVWCASSSLTNDADSIDVLGGQGERKSWFGVIVKCGIDHRILGWYVPS